MTPEPAGPVGPVGPTGPPEGPCGPVGPTGPTGPVTPAPIDPCDPAGPVGPVTPAPVGPCGPVGPIGPPAGPIRPRGPIGPCGPCGPAGILVLATAYAIFDSRVRTCAWLACVIAVNCACSVLMRAASMSVGDATIFLDILLEHEHPHCRGTRRVRQPVLGDLADQLRYWQTPTGGDGAQRQPEFILQSNGSL